MTYRELFYKATRLIDKGDITLGEYEEMTKPLDREIEQEPKTGHWIFDEMLDRNYYCSECKSMGVDYWDYCPYCGCRMVEPQAESENKG